MFMLVIMFIKTLAVKKLVRCANPKIDSVTVYPSYYDVKSDTFLLYMRKI